MSWKTIRYEGQVDFTNFHCDEPILNTYLHTKAVQEHNADICTLYFLVDNLDRIGGFYVLNNSSIDKNQQMPPGSGKRNYPYKSIGTVHIGRLARNKDLVGLKLGKLIMYSAFEVAAESAKISAAALITVDAKNHKAETFYAQFGFKDLINIGQGGQYPKPMYIKMITARSIIKPN